NPRRSFAGEHAARNGHVFTASLLGHGDGVGKRALFANFGEFDQHGKIDAREHFDLWAAHAGDREVRWRATKHVGEDGNTITAVYAIDRFDNVASTQIGIVLCPDRDGFDLLLWTHDMFERGLELVSKPPMGHKY